MKRKKKKEGKSTMVHYKNLISLVACRNLHRRFCTPRSRDEEEDILVLFFLFFFLFCFCFCFFSRDGVTRSLVLGLSETQEGGCLILLIRWFGNGLS